MKNLIIWGALACLFTKASAQNLTEQPAPVNAAYAVNTPAVKSRPVNHRVSATTDSGTLMVPQDGDDASRVKNVSKSFPADQTDKVSLTNEYGSMVIKVWDKREVKIDISIRAYAGSDKETQNMIDQVNIDAGKSGDQIFCKTNIDRGSSRNFWSSRGKRREVKVDYVVYMPASNPLSLSQEYGNVNIDNFSGPLSAKLEYGNFTAGNLSGTNNYISVQYGKTNIEELNKATVKQEYGAGLIIGTVRELDLNAEYAGVTINTIKGDATIKQQYGAGLKIGTVNNLNLNIEYAGVNLNTVKGNAVIRQEYSSLTIGSVGKIDLRSEYAGVKIGALKGDGSFKMSYKNLNIDDIGAACRSLYVDVDYVAVDLGFADGFGGSFTLDKSYGGFKYGAGVKSTQLGSEEDKKDSSSKKYAGKIGNGGSSTVRIKSEYGSVVFK